MSGAGRSDDWASARKRGPTVTVAATQTGGPPGASRPPGSRGRANSSGQGLYVPIVMSLLVASTALALYDLYLLASLVAAP